MCIWLLIPEQKRVNAYNTTDTDTHMSAYYYWKGYWCWHFQRKMLLLLLLLVLHEAWLYQNYRRNLLAIQSSLDSTNKRQCSHIHEFLEEGCAALSYNTRYYLFLFCWVVIHVTSLYEIRSHVLMCFVCICGSLFYSGIWPLVAISRHLCFHSSLIWTVYYISCWHAAM